MDPMGILNDSFSCFLFPLLIFHGVPNRQVLVAFELLFFQEIWRVCTQIAWKPLKSSGWVGNIGVVCFFFPRPWCIIVSISKLFWGNMKHKFIDIYHVNGDFRHFFQSFWIWMLTFSIKSLPLLRSEHYQILIATHDFVAPNTTIS